MELTLAPIGEAMKGVEEKVDVQMQQFPWLGQGGKTCSLKNMSF